jgi:hypothetical protein
MNHFRAVFAEKRDVTPFSTDICIEDKAIITKTAVAQ